MIRRRSATTIFAPLKRSLNRCRKIYNLVSPRVTVQNCKPGRNIAALNAATEGLPADRVRLHICWGNYEGRTPTTCR
jgi:hypothetical protein